MTELTATQQPTTRSFWIISGLALVWNLIGVATYMMTVTLTPEAIAEMPEAERALYTDIPTWVTSAYAIAVFTGFIGSVLLLMKRGIAYPIFIVSLIAIVAQMSYSLFMSDAIAVQGPSAAVLPILVAGIAGFLVWYSSKTKQQGILR